MQTITLEIKTIDRLGITHDVSTCVARSNLDILRMEVKSSFIYLKVSSSFPQPLAQIIEQISQVAGVERVERISYMPAEERENRIHTILSTIQEGIVSVDEHLRITTMNRAAMDMLPRDADQMIGEPIERLWGADAADITRCLHEGLEISNVHVRFPHRGRKASSVVCSYRPIMSSSSLTGSQGVVIVLRDMKQISELIQSVQRSGMFTFDEIIHQSPEMKRCIDTSRRIARSGATIFLQGESGTGKELFARAIHFESPRASSPFVPINCAAIPDALLESELFGYEEGAFTGALKGGKPGLFELAQGGTLFLDEIGEIPLHLQAKLLRVLEDRTIRRIGSGKTIPIDVRIIAATNRNLAAMTSKGLFREDLFYRLHVIPIVIPPLRERRSDIPLLADFFVQKICCQLGRSPLTLTYRAIRALQEQSWPGNVRQLQNVLERAVYLSMGTEIDADLFDHRENHGVESSVEKHIHANQLPREGAKPLLFKQQVEAFERNLLLEALQQHKSVRKTAAQLGLSHTAVLKKLKKWGLMQGPYATGDDSNRA